MKRVEVTEGLRYEAGWGARNTEHVYVLTQPELDRLVYREVRAAQLAPLPERILRERRRMQYRAATRKRYRRYRDLALYVGEPIRQPWHVHYRELEQAAWRAFS